MIDNLVGVWAGTQNSSSAPPIMTAQTLAPNDINRTRWRRRQWEEVEMKRPSLFRSVLLTIMSAFSSVMPPTGHCHYSQQPEESSVSTDWWRRRVCWLFPRRWHPSPRQDWKQNAPCTPDRKYTPRYTCCSISTDICATADRRAGTLTKGTLFLSSWTARLVLDTETWMTPSTRQAETVNVTTETMMKVLLTVE